MPRTNKKFGWVPDLPDHRDFMYSAPARVVTGLPPKADLRPKCPPVVDQGNLGSCTANAIGNAHRFNQMKESQSGDFMPSRLFIYYNERVLQSLPQIKGCLASGYPFVFGFTVYESFQSATVAKTGTVPMPGHGEKAVGGHAVLAVGYDDTKQRV